MRRTKEEAEETRLLLLETGLLHFAQFGVDASSISKIARDAGLTRGAFYWHFPDKWALFDAIWRHHASPFDPLQEATTDTEEPDPLGKFKELLKAFLKRLDRDDQMQKLMVLIFRESTFWNEQIPEAVQTLLDEFDQRRIASLKNAVIHQQLPSNFDCNAGSQLIKMMIDGLIINWLQNPKLYPLAQQSELFIDQLIDQLSDGNTLLKTR